MNMVNIAQDNFRSCMNPPEDGFDGIATVKNISRQQVGNLPVVRKESCEDSSGDQNFKDAV